MANNNRWVVGLFSLGAMTIATACDEDGSDLNHGLSDEVANDDHIDFTPVDEELTFRGAVENGRELNGTALNGKLFNGKLFNGKLFNGTALGAAIERINGARTAAVLHNAHPLTNIQLVNGSLMSAYDTVTAQTKLGEQLAGTTFNIDFDPMANGGENLVFKINSVSQSILQNDVYFYNVEQLNELNVFETLCRDGAGNPTQAIALPGTWDPERATRQSGGTGKFTWACRGASLAKAVEWGYRPWASAAMNDAHQATMRMIRADYCGDGVTHTSNGNPIDISDKWNLQSPETSWAIEAKWGPNGAVCLNTPRKLWWPRSSIPCAASLPYCTDNGLANGVVNTSPAQYGGLIMNQVVPNDTPSAY